MSEPVMERNCPRVQRNTPAARASPHHWKYGEIYEPGMGPYPLRVALARFHLWGVEFVVKWRYF